MEQRHELAFRHTACAMTVALALSLPHAAMTAGPRSEGREEAALTVTSVPAGAAVYVDGRRVGETPLRLAALRPGAHRVRVNQRGYLENSRSVDVVAGRTSELEVNLTPLPESAARRQARASAATQGEEAPAVPPAVEPAPAKGGSKLKYILPAAVVAVGGGFAAYKLATKNHAPSASGRVSRASSGLARLTSFEFDGSASRDPDGDSLRYEWSFGDGSTGSGVRVTHNYDAADTYAVSLAVSDGKADASVPVGSVTVTEVLPPLVDPAPPSAALQAATAVVVSARTTSDPDGDTLSYSWSFGDGSAGAGPTTTHAYMTSGDRVVTLTTSDGRSSATSTAAATVRGMTGIWRGPTWGGYTLTLTQTGATITGTYLDSDGPGIVEVGSVAAPRTVHITVMQDLGPVVFRWFVTCAVDAAIDTCSGAATTMTRQ